MANFLGYVSSTTGSISINYDGYLNISAYQPVFDVNQIKICMEGKCKTQDCVVCNVIDKNWEIFQSRPRFKCKRCLTRLQEAKCKNYVCTKCTKEVNYE